MTAALPEIGARVAPTKKAIKDKVLKDNVGVVSGYGSGSETRNYCKILWGKSTIPDLVHPIFLVEISK
jgi:hypothetical protein